MLIAHGCRNDRHEQHDRHNHYMAMLIIARLLSGHACETPGHMRVTEKHDRTTSNPNAESYQVIYYGKTQQYRRHYDGWLFDNSDKTERMLKKGGQRILTVLCYLNDVKEGGGTEFPRLNLNIKAKKGRIVIFQNVEDGSNVRHKLSEHAGMPVLDGEKFAFNLWFREKKF